MNKSESIKELATAYALAQKEIEGAAKDKVNPAFRSKYADLGSVVDAIKPALSSHGLSFLQSSHDAENAAKVETILLHASGEWMSLGCVSVPVTKFDAHGFGSALTYARRYGLLTAFGVAPEDDDGNAATKAPPKEASAGGPSMLKREAFDAMPKDEQEFLRGIAANVTALLQENRAYDAYGYWINQKLDTEEMVAIQSLWDSKERSALTKAAAEWKLANTPSTRGDNHKGATPQREAA
jgi:hypothetical protein